MEDQITYSPPPPPPPPPPAATGGASWWRSPTALFLIGILIAAAIAVPVVFLVLGGDDDEPTAVSSTTTSAATTTGGSSTTAGTSTTAATTTSSSSTSTSSSTTSSSTTSSTTTTTTTSTTAPLELDPTAAVNYLEFDLTSGFLPDPWERAAQSGGPVDVSYLGGGCAGWASGAPDFQMDYTAAASSLRIYFIADAATEDTTLIINDPLGNWVCGDDSYGTRHPTVDFTGTAPDGIYDIWIGSYGVGTFNNGTLYITELDANHP